MLIRNRQVAAIKEDIEGIAESLTATDAKFLVEEPKVSDPWEKNPRNIVRGTLSPTGTISGLRPRGISFRTEVRGSGTATNAPAWGLLLQACGHTQNTLRKLTIGAVTGGPFQHGEAISQATSGATGRVVIETANGTTTLYVVEDKDSAAFNGTNEVTGGTSGATATPSAAANIGIEWKPASNELSQVAIGSVTSGPFTKDEIITGGTSGAKGKVAEATADGASVLRYVPVSEAMQSGETVTGGTSGASATTSSAATQSVIPSLTIGAYEDQIRKLIIGARGKNKWTFEVGKQGMVDWEFMGRDGDETDTSLLSGVTHETTIPPAFLDASLTIDDFTPVVRSVEIDMAQTLAPRNDANNANGIIGHKISNREPQMIMLIEKVLVSTYDFGAKRRANTQIKVDFQIGSTAGNVMRFYIPKAVITDMQDEEADGIDMVRITFSLTANVSEGDDEISILHL